MSLSDNKKDNFSQAAVFDSCVDVNIYTILYRKAARSQLCTHLPWFIVFLWSLRGREHDFFGDKL